MTWAVTAPALGSLLASVDGSVVTRIGDRLVRSDGDILDLFTTMTTQGQRAIRAIIVTRQSVSEEPYTSLQNQAFETYVIRVLWEFNDVERSELQVNAYLDGVLEALRNVEAIGIAEEVSAAKTSPVALATVGPYPVHSAEVTVVTRELYATGSVAGMADSVASSQSGVTDCVYELAGLIGAASTESVVVHTYPRLVMTDADALDLFTVQEGAERKLRAWQVYRESVTETRELSQLVMSEDAWKLDSFWGWKDSELSYSAHQKHLDAVRTQIRLRPDLGNPRNSSLAASSPLQIERISGRQVRGFACHHAECSVKAEVWTHATQGG